MKTKSAVFPILLLILFSALSLAQNTQPVQVAVNTGYSQPARNEAIVPSMTDLQTRLEAQQKQIEKLTALVEQLQASRQPIASVQPMVPSGLISYLAEPASPSPSPSPSPAPTPMMENGYMSPRELLPDIGHIGAELGFFAGGSTNPYKADKGLFTGGFIDLPWKKVPGGKLSYEIMIGLQRSVSTVQTTSGVNVLVNAALNSYLQNTAGNATSIPNFLASPLPITSTVEERAKVLTVAPFELKYTITKLGRVRPYVIGGLGAYVWIGSDNNTKSFNAIASLKTAGIADPTATSLGTTLNAILRGSQIGGLVPTAPELAARGVP